MAAQVPFTSSVTASFPTDAGKSPVDHDNTVAGTFESKVDLDLVLTGSGTQTVDFGSIATNGAKVVQIEVDPDSSPAAAPVNVQFNGAGAPGNIEISPGGHMNITNPNPTAGGILSMDIVHTTNACVHVRILG